MGAEELHQGVSGPRRSDTPTALLAIGIREACGTSHHVDLHLVFHSDASLTRRDGTEAFPDR